MAIGLGCEKRGAVLGLPTKTGNRSSAAAGEPGLTPAAAARGTQRARLLRPGPAPASSRVLPSEPARPPGAAATRPWPRRAVPAQGSLSPAAGSSPLF